MSTVYSVVDIETTGGQSSENKITEIAIINTDGEKIIEEFSTLINPERSIPSQITYLTGITNEMVKDAPKFYEVAKKIVEMTSGHVFVAHNVFFDFNFIKHEFSELGYSFQAEKICTVRMSRKILPGHASYSLGKLCNDLGIPLKNRHRAMGDAKATCELLWLLLKKNGDFSSFMAEESKKISLPPLLNRSNYESLPSTPGVYYFYDKEGELLYIGKANDIKKRAASHFRVDMKRKKDIELKTSIARIEVRPMGNELSSLLMECHEIKKHRPRFNRSLNRIRFPYTLLLKEDKEGENFIHITRSKLEIGILRYNNIQAAKKARNRMIRSILGVDYDSIHFEQTKKNTISTLGLNHYNDLLHKIYMQQIPKLKDDTIKLKGRVRGEHCYIKIEDYCPQTIIFTNEDEEEKIGLLKDPDMVQILRRYLKEHHGK